MVAFAPARGDKCDVRRGKKAGPQPGGRVSAIDQRRKRRRRPLDIWSWRAEV